MYINDLPAPWRGLVLIRFFEADRPLIAKDNLTLIRIQHARGA
jgi:hypothetical protein